MSPHTRNRRRVFVVDDHPLVRESLVALINRQADMTVSGEAGESADAFGRMVQETPDVAVVDISLPGESGLELVKRLQALSPAPAVLVLSMHDEALYAERALRAGALGYVMKRETTSRVIDAIRTVLRGQVYLSGECAVRLAGKYVGARGVADPVGAKKLSDRELEVFQRIGLGHTTKRIAEDLHLSMKTVQAHCASMKEKLGAANATELIREAVRWMEARRAGEDRAAP